MVAYAQVPPLALPPLPGQPTAAPMPAQSSAPLPPIADAKILTVGSVDVGAVDITGKKDNESGALIAVAPPPLPNESADKSVNSGIPPVNLPPAPDVALASSALPTLNVEAPLPEGVGIPATTNFAVPPLPLPSATENAVPQAPAKAAPPKTWLSKLAPSVVPPTLNFRYRREMLPDAVYRKSYTLENRHLPVAVTTDDYQQMFLMSVARNDIEATRAFLNRGMPINTVNRNGETALALAQRYGASDTAQLLILRGAR